MVAGRRIGLAQIVDQPQEVGNFSTTFCSWDDGALTSLIALPLTQPRRGIEAVVPNPTLKLTDQVRGRGGGVAAAGGVVNLSMVLG